MGLFASLDTELQKDLLNFVEEREKQPWPRKMGDELLTSVLKDIIKGPCSITGWARKGNKCWMELTWNFDKNDQKKSEEAVKKPGRGGRPRKEKSTDQILDDMAKRRGEL